MRADQICQWQLSLQPPIDDCWIGKSSLLFCTSVQKWQTVACYSSSYHSKLHTCEDTRLESHSHRNKDRSWWQVWDHTKPKSTLPSCLLNSNSDANKKSLKEKMTKPESVFVVLRKWRDFCAISGTSGCVICSVVRTSRVPAVALRPHTLSALSPRSAAQSKPQVIAPEDPFISRLAANQQRSPAPNQMQDSAFTRWACLQMDDIIELWSEKMLLLETPNCPRRTNVFSAIFTVVLTQFEFT